MKGTGARYGIGPTLQCNTAPLSIFPSCVECSSSFRSEDSRRHLYKWGGNSSSWISFSAAAAWTRKADGRRWRWVLFLSISLDSFFFSIGHMRCKDGPYLKARLHWHKWTRKLPKIVADRSNVATIFSPWNYSIDDFDKNTLFASFLSCWCIVHESKRRERERQWEKGTCSLSFPCCRRPSPPPQFMDSEQGGRHGEVQTPTVAHIKPPQSPIRGTV